MNGIVLFDSGILLRASTTTLDHSDLCFSLWVKARGGTIRACVSQQTMFEFFSVLTRLRVPHGRVLDEMQKHLAVFPLISPKSTTFPAVLTSLRRLRWLTGPQVYDLVLAHTALDNNVRVLYTLNDRHFRKFGLPLQVVNPTSPRKGT